MPRLTPHAKHQISKAAASLDGLDPQVRAALAHRTGKDNAAGIRGTISAIEGLNKFGTRDETKGSASTAVTPRTPAPPTQEDTHDSQAEPVRTRRGHVLPNYMQQSENGNAYMRSLQAELEDLERTDPDVAKAAQRLQEALDRIRMNIHQVYVLSKTLRCTKSCSGPAPHLDEYRAADVRPPAEQTARNNAADADKLPSSNKT